MNQHSMKNILIAIAFVSSTLSFANFPTDSVGTTTKNGVVYTIHEITAGETFYALSKKYALTVEEIQKVNPDAKTLAIGQKLLIPTKIAAAKTPVASPPSSSTKTPPATPSTNTKIHTVAAGEGLFSIAKKYAVSVDNLVTWNKLESSAINVGQTLVVSAPIENKPASQLPASAKTTTHTVAAGEGLYGISKEYGVTVEEIQKWNNMTTTALEVGQVLVVKKGEAPKSAPIKVNEKKPSNTATAKNPSTNTINHPKKIVTTTSTTSHNRKEETGVISLTALPQYNTKFSYGLHKNAPVGTIVKITNKTTGKIHWVRIMGPLDASDTSIMKVNQTVLEKLGEGATSFEADISYAL